MSLSLPPFLQHFPRLFPLSFSVDLSTYRFSHLPIYLSFYTLNRLYISLSICVIQPLTHTCYIPLLVSFTAYLQSISYVFRSFLPPFFPSIPLPFVPFPLSFFFFLLSLPSFHFEAPQYFLSLPYFSLQCFSLHSFSPFLYPPIPSPQKQPGATALSAVKRGGGEGRG